jgi:SAM-dependent methyltransferase
LKRQLLDLLCCPACHASLALVEAHETSGEVESGQLVCGTCAQRYPIVRHIPRFVPSSNYADTFGLQWNLFRTTQLDSHSGLALSRERFFRSSAWTPEELAGKTILDVGCGAGRFAEVALSTGAHVVALDYSSAADACWQNLGPHPRLHVVQADIYHLPFKQERFDFVYCFGVLQTTPDVETAFLALPAQLRPGGKLVIDIYAKLFLNWFWPKYWLRLVTTRMRPERLLPLVRGMVGVLLPVSLRIGCLPLIGRKLRYALPVANYAPDFPLSPAQLKEWAILDTFDMLAPRYDQPQSAQTLLTWFHKAGLQDVKVFRMRQLVGRGGKPESRSARCI